MEGLSLDRKLDIAGVILTLVGGLAILGLISPSNSLVIGKLFSLIRMLFGWGMYVMPIGMIVIGLWLILRDFERVPQIAVEPLTGIVVLYANFLAILHFLAFPVDQTASYALAAAGKGGGYLGGWASALLIGLLGQWGTAIALLAWMLIGIMLTLDVSMVDLFRWAPPIINATKQRGQAFLSQQALAWQQKRTAQGGAVAEPPAVFTGEPVALTPTTVPSPVSKTGEPHAWTLPPIPEMLEEGVELAQNDDHDRERAQTIEETLTSFGAPVQIVEIKHGPTITQFGVEPLYLETRNGRTRVRVNKISALADDLALALAASRVRIQAPVPGKGYVGIEVPNDHLSLVALRDQIESQAFRRLRSPLRLALGQDVSGNAVAANLAVMPHLLIAGATGSGKSVCVNTIISCLLLHNTPNDLRLLMVDPKRVELTGYNGIPHLLAPVVVEMERVIGALQWMTREMDSRYQKFHDTGARNITSYNKIITEKGGTKLPYLVIIIDELADLMMLAPDQTEKTVTRLAQLARATGIHLIIATQRPSVDVVTGLIKANFPARIAFAVASGVDSRVILDQPGAERLLGRGDMLFQAPDAPAPVRLQGVFVSDPEIARIVQFWRGQIRSETASPLHTDTPADAAPQGLPLRQMPFWEEMEAEENLDPVFSEAVDLVRRQGRASISMLQRRMRIGYTRAARLIETMEEKGIIGPPEGGAQTRAVLDYGPAAPPVDD